MKTKDGFKLGKRFTCWAFNKRFELQKITGKVVKMFNKNNEYAYFQLPNKSFGYICDEEYPNYYNTYTLFRKRENAKKFAKNQLNGLKAQFSKKINKLQKQIDQI